MRLDGLTKSAIFLVSLGVETASKVLKCMDEKGSRETLDRHRLPEERLGRAGRGDHR